GYFAPEPKEVITALNKFKAARATLPNSKVLIESEDGIVDVPYLEVDYVVESINTQDVYESKGRGLFKVKMPDMLSNAMWRVVFNGKSESVKITHSKWIEDYHARRIHIDPHDCLDADYIQRITYDENQLEVENFIELTYIHRVVPPPQNKELFKD
ncbi:unnamed protein product, partial [Chrysoparadoxa australica]